MLEFGKSSLDNNCLLEFIGIVEALDNAKTYLELNAILLDSTISINHTESVQIIENLHMICVVSFKNNVCENNLIKVTTNNVLLIKYLVNKERVRNAL